MATELPLSGPGSDEPRGDIADQAELLIEAEEQELIRAALARRTTGGVEDRNLGSSHSWDADRLSSGRYTDDVDQDDQQLWSDASEDSSDDPYHAGGADPSTTEPLSDSERLTIEEGLGPAHVLLDTESEVELDAEEDGESDRDDFEGL